MFTSSVVCTKYRYFVFSIVSVGKVRSRTSLTVAYAMTTNFVY